jgi:putative hemolysin
MAPVTEPAEVGSRHFTVALAQSEAEVREAQRLRFEVFARECGAELHTDLPGYDRDRFDDYCDHVLVRDRSSGEVVGTYRILEPRHLSRTGGFYAEQEFDLSRLRLMQQQTVEVGRSCIHPNYRRGAVIALLWSGLGRYVVDRGYDYVMGCASIPLSDGGGTVIAAYHDLSTRCMSSEAWRVFPHHPYPVDETQMAASPILPPLIKGYVRLGASLCGEPAWDRLFKTADLLMLLPIADMNHRYARHFLHAPDPAAVAA